jgi:flagellar biosynthesis/type III secretory pathway M-ring protein FliF/YscJ
MGTGMPGFPFLETTDDDWYVRRVSERNYEINQRITTIAYAQGYIRDMSISVVLDNTMFDEDFTDEVRGIVTGLVTHPASRISVSSLPFTAENEARTEAQRLMEEIAESERQRELFEMFLRWGVILALGITALLLLYSIFKRPKLIEEEEELLLAGGEVDYLVGEDGEILYDEFGNPILAMGEDDDEALIELRKKSDALGQIEKFIERNSFDVAQLLRNWLAED